MAIPITASQATAKDLHVSAPRQFIEIDLGGSFIRLASGEQINWNGKTFVKSGLRVSEVKTGKAGVQRCRIQLIDADDIWKDLVFSTGFIYRPVKYWTVWGAQPYSIDDPLLAFSGEIVRVPTMSSTVTFDCMTKNAAQRKSPNILLSAPDIKHMPRPGQKFLIGNELFIVELD